MAPKPPSSDDQKPAAADGRVAPELDEELARKRAAKPAVGKGATGRVVGDKTAAPSPREDDDDDEEPDDEDDDQDEDEDEDEDDFDDDDEAGPKDKEN